MKEILLGPKKMGQTIYVRLWRAGMSEEQKAEQRERDALRARLKRAQKTEQQKAKENLCKRLRNARLTGEQKATKRERDKLLKRRLRKDPEYKQKAYDAQRRWAKANHQKYRASANLCVQRYRRKKRADADPAYMAGCAIRNILNRFRNVKWDATLKEALGCDRDWFMVWMEIQFKDGMSWSNHGKWEIDHIRPVSSFDLSNLDELRKVHHFTNLQPLWKADNRLKRNLYGKGVVYPVKVPEGGTTP